MQTLVGSEPQFDIEHILPFRRSLDNSFANKTLCYHEVNRNRKRNKTPLEAFGNTPEWAEICQRVRRFRGSTADEKLRRFHLEQDDSEFTNRHLSDTRYISRLAAEYLGLLYGGRIDAEGRLRVCVSSGGATAFVREQLDLNGLLGGEDKNRSDHRHHAIDAVVIALTGPDAIKALADAAERADHLGGRRLFAEFDASQVAWQGLKDDCRQALESIIVSSRVSHKLNGQLHDANPLSQPHAEVRDGKATTVHYIRKPLKDLSPGEIKAIVDDRVRELVTAKLQQLGGTPAQAFKDPNNHPYFTTGDGRLVPIHRARIKKPDKTISVGSGSALRYMKPGANHHLEVVAILGTDGQVRRWEFVVVSRFEAMQRLRARRNGEDVEVIRRNHGPGRKFLFSLAGGDHVEMRRGSEGRGVYRVTVISEGRVELVRHCDARPISERKTISGARLYGSPTSLRENGARKVVVDPIGNLIPARD